MISLSQLVKPAGYNVDILVIDNNDEKSRWVGDECITVGARYRFEPTPGLSSARNAALATATAMGTDWLAFIDDDERADRLWLVAFTEIIERLSNESGWTCEHCGQGATRPVDAVHGVIQYAYPPDAAPWRCRDPWGSWGDVDGKELDCAGTGNVIFRASVARGLRFDEALNTSGGEDTDFFRRFHRERGGRIVLSLHALATETVTWDRITLRGHCRKAFRNGFMKEPRLKRPIRKALQRLVSGLTLLIVAPLVLVAGKNRALKTMLAGILKISEALGIASARSGGEFNYYAKTTGQ
jgi:succinoglycan biosynthesis protein ExoM